ncbi:GDYXXLXY domain-containing protein [Parachitinimonas caeni]|uniref:GDYXXLXY domain-containing protein n=1 Tax=Parachitinimonas caeni TaxID=3031301 RepID=A0ABT7DU69_9NEIS|nr:GDYXXLXY domain-containing protein [Parachitinimonas caeni]MDK2123581.1 GDYXXLXY domain-containing protein [Parachitinimonas caeni]
MKASRIDSILRSAIHQGLLPAEATEHAPDRRPWPIVLLIALGAWLATLPLLLVTGALFGDFITRSAGSYLVGSLLLAGTITLFRSKNLPLFVEQLAVPGLLVGATTFCFGLYRDLPDQAASAMMVVIAITVAALVKRPWLQTILGATAAVFGTMTALPLHWFDYRQDHLLIFWLAWHAGFVAWVISQYVLRHVLERDGYAEAAGTLDAFASGWLLTVLLGLSMWSGMTFLLGGSLANNEVVALGREIYRYVFPEEWTGYATRLSSLGICLAAFVQTSQRWPSLRQPWLAGVAAILAGFSWLLPALGAVLFGLAHCLSTKRWRLAIAAGLACAWIIGSFYYQLSLPLATKAAILTGAAVVLGALIGWAHRSSSKVRALGPAHSQPKRSPATLLGVGASLGLTLLVANIGIWQKEDIIRTGQPVYVALAPVDPRSLMQGDYMALRFRLPPDAENQLRRLLTDQRPHAIARLDAQGVAELLRVTNTDTPLQAGEIAIELSPKHGEWVLVTDAWYFKEGEAERWANARYGEFRVRPDGKALLVGLADAQLKAIQP